MSPAQVWAPSQEDWLALCLLTESNRPEEWPYIAAVILNRVASPRYPNTPAAVVLQRKQFSAFNEYTSNLDAHPDPAGVFLKVYGAIKSDGSGRKLFALLAARGLAEAALADTEILPATITPATMHYYSPVSMSPPGSAPFWAAVDKAGKLRYATRLYTPPGIDSQRFVFAEGVS